MFAAMVAGTKAVYKNTYKLILALPSFFNNANKLGLQHMQQRKLLAKLIMQF